MSFTEAIQSQYISALSQAGLEERSFREHAWAEYARLGLPDRKNELWKYTSLAAVTSAAWTLAGKSGSVPAEAEQLRARYGGNFNVLVLLNGELTGSAPAGVSVFQFAAGEASAYEDGWTGMSAAVSRPGIELRVAKGVKLAKPVLLLHCFAGAEHTWSPSVKRIVLEENAAAEVAEVYIGADGEYLRSELTLARLSRSATLSWLRIQSESLRGYHYANVNCELAEGARVYATLINSGAQWSRSVFRVLVNGEQAEAHISGLTFTRGQQHSDQRVEVRHLVGQTVSSQLFKGVLKDRSRAVVNGKIFIGRGAQKVSSSHLNHNLLLTPQAEADTKPELEIYADDVKANHGASIGRLDEDKIFYLTSRGITRGVARQMLAEAFVADVLMKIPSPILLGFARDQVQAVLPEFSSELEAKI